MDSNTNNRLFDKRSDLISAINAFVHIAFVLCPVYLAAVQGPGFSSVVFWLWCGLSINGLLNMMHECAHYHTFERRSWCDFLGRWILAPLFFADFDNYRDLHWEHHRSLGGEGDPKYTYKVSIKGAQFPLFVLQCLFGIEALKKFGYLNKNRGLMNQTRSPFWLVRLAVTQSIFLLSLLGAAYWSDPQELWWLWRAAFAYAFVYVYGVVSLTLFMATMRAIAEHQPGVDNPPLVGNAALRNLRCGHIGRLLLGCYGFAEHATHHRSPYIPSYHLVLATKELSAGDQTLVPELTYFGVLKQQVVQPKS